MLGEVYEPNLNLKTIKAKDYASVGRSFDQDFDCLQTIVCAHSIKNLASLEDRQNITGDSDAKLKSNGSWSRCLDTFVLRYICISRR